MGRSDTPFLLPVTANSGRSSGERTERANMGSGRHLGVATSIVAIAIVLELMSTAARGASLSTLVSFNGSDGYEPDGTLISDSAGNLYGTTVSGGQGYGTIYRFNPHNTTLTTLASFSKDNGANPYGGLMLDADGNLFGASVGGGANGKGTIYELPVGSNTISALASFNGSNGFLPYCSLIADASGNLYGTTEQGGATNKGTVFKFDPTTGTINTLVSFNVTNGSSPHCTLMADAAGKLYGTTGSGGGFNSGTVFKLDPATGALTSLITFGALDAFRDFADGNSPQAGLIADAAGNLYGTTMMGGAYTYGEVFKLAAGTNRFSRLGSFDLTTEQWPLDRLLVDATGNLYGTTAGLSHTLTGGTVFEIAAGSTQITNLATFNNTNGLNPAAGLIADAAGNLYGTTSYGGAFGSGDGTLFEVTGSNFVVPEPGGLLLLGIAVAATRRRARPSGGAE